MPHSLRRMPKIALADLLVEWKRLLQAAAPFADQKGLSTHLQKLKAAIEQFEELEALRAELQARRQRATQELEQVKTNGKDAAMETRQLLKAIFGVKSERLVQFQIRPRRSRRKIAALPPATDVPSAES
jgi:DNA anti-recombination protein RmuC